jgi:dipeptidyl-peptidase-4
MTRFLILLLAGWLAGAPFARAQQEITLEDIWKTYTFYSRSVSGFNFLEDGRHYTRKEGNAITQYDLTTGELTDTLFFAPDLSGQNGFPGRLSRYSFGPDEAQLLIETETESIYRYSTRANFFVYDRAGETILPLYEGDKQRYATISPDGEKVAFVLGNNLYYRDLTSGELVQVTEDGEQNAVINGATDWVYEEEFAIAKAFEWSPDSRRLAFLRFDERRVKEFTMTNYRDEMYPEYVTFKYPKVGEDNALVSAHIYDLKKGKTIRVDTGEETDIYLPRIRWTEDPDQLCVVRMNRHQNRVDLLLASAKSGKTRLLLQETNPYYISESVLDNLRFLEDGRQFIWTSERDGWHHIYLYDMKGELQRQITRGEWEITNFYGVDEAGGKLYFQAARRSPMERQIFEIGLDGQGLRELSPEPGSNSAEFSSTFDYFVLTHSTANTPPVISVYDRSGERIRTIQDNERVRELQDTYGTTPVEFFDFTTSEGVALNGWMIKPPDMDESAEHPVLLYVYGGPGSQLVTDSWKGQNYWWFQMLAQQGYVVACVDNRGTGGRGQEFKKMTYRKLGHYETKDQIEVAKYLGSLPYIDAGRIGIFGWSYGGYMSSLAILKGNEVFKAAIAVAPVTNWKWYDTIYTEHFMRTFAENPEGFEENSPIYFADRLRGNYLLVHGMGDDNVHFQHTVEMANALINANKQFETYFYPNRNHGIYGGVTRLHLYQKMTNFLDQKLKGSGLDNDPDARP